MKSVDRNWKKTTRLAILILALTFQLLAVGSAFGQSSAPVLNPLQIALGRWYHALDAADSSVRDVVPMLTVFDGENIWVAGKSTGYRTAYIHKLRKSDGAVLATATNEYEVTGIAFDGAGLWTAHNAAHSSYLVKRSLSSGNPTSKSSTPIALPDIPGDVLFDGTHIWVTVPRRSLIVKVHARDHVVLGQYDIRSPGSRMTFDGNYIWMSDPSNDKVIKLGTDGAIRGIYSSCGKSPEGIAFDGRYIWVTLAGSDAVAVLSSEGYCMAAYSTSAAPLNLYTNTALHRPSRIAFDGVYLWITNNLSNTVAKLRSGGLIGVFPVGLSPVGIAFDGANIWIANSGSGSVSKR